MEDEGAGAGAWAGQGQGEWRAMGGPQLEGSDTSGVITEDAIRCVVFCVFA